MNVRVSNDTSKTSLSTKEIIRVGARVGISVARFKLQTIHTSAATSVRSNSKTPFVGKTPFDAAVMSVVKYGSGSKSILRYGSGPRDFLKY